MDQPPSPPPLDRSALPEGQCRYILLVPGIKGQRCACAHFSHNQSTPGATCDCGHMACYHVKTAEQPAEKRELDLLKQRLEVVERQLDREQQGAFGNQSTPGATCDCGHMACYHVKTAEQPAEKRELDLLKQRLEVVERQLDREQQGAFGSLVSRLGELEDRLDKTHDEATQEIRTSYHDEATQEIRTSYRNINRVWQSVELLEQRCLQLHEAMRTESIRVTKIDHQMRDTSRSGFAGESSLHASAFPCYPELRAC
ncbi:hypothetical protein HYQ45_011030 [Verticillium longisporum]|uniref:Uncharacterized protein n=1 Tax=Verticillium longisporum TaxID=100787 RepID=A0A8I3ANZ1_VERLO|nr:hypothetical protein HYQ45_011030 [Verticillium longisporum]